jgi:hypothetical protein
LNRAGISMEAIVIVQSLAKDPGQLCSCFISHSTADLEFATLLYGNLQSNRVRCFLLLRMLGLVTPSASA